jgi:ribosomal protein S18 acetylase RimI-like enzyme
MQPEPNDKKIAVEVREIEMEDLAPVYALGEGLFTADRWTSLHRTWDEYEILNLYMTDGDTCLVAEVEGRVIGFALGATIEKRRSSWKYGYLIWLGVVDDMKSHGVGKKLVKRLTELFIQKGVRMMLVDTEADNHEAIRFFKRVGFGDEQEHVYMSSNLTKHPLYEKLRPNKPAHKPRKPDANGGEP